ncbi:signal peptidase I [Flavobacterium sp. KS-LB2]|uniref:signal peptidase I n=1 Tax=Flavobacterium sp. KS-LB2 TaxID=3120525 RepID=UPI0030D583B2
MSAYQWFVFFLLVQLVHFLGTWKLYESAGRKKWEAAIPVYNAIVLMKIIGRPTWWTILLFIPIINLIMFPVIWVETIRSFGKRSGLDTFLVLITLGFYIYYINYAQKLEYRADRSLNPENKAADTISSLLFAIVVATIVHTYFIQPYTIPTSSLEKSLLVGDFLFVSKMNYGARVPMTTVALPMVHDSIPLTKSKSYLTWPQLPYMRLPGIQNIDRTDIVVFNWPVDTVHYFFEPKGIPGVIKPIDKESNYVKRCLGLPGDNLSIKDGIVYIDGKELKLPERAKPQFSYTAKIRPSEGIDYQYLFSELNDYKNDAGGFTDKENLYFPALTDDMAVKLKNISGVYDIKKNIDIKNTRFTYEFTYDRNIKDEGFLNMITTLKESGQFYIREMTGNTILITNLPPNIVEILSKQKSVIKVKEISDIFPHNGFIQKNWTRDNFGPIYIPKAGKTIALDLKTLPFYERIIKAYEKDDKGNPNILTVTGNEIRINGKVVKEYTFKQDYYWMMGDNRHNSEDSRYWGFVPADHIVGKPIFIWLSIEGINDGIKNWSVRWDRVFTTVSGEGQPQSYFKYFLIALAAFFIGEYFWKKRKEAKN